MSLQTLGARIADLLAAEGVSKLFSLPEVTFGTVHDALHKHGIPMIAPHHEAVAGFMAEAYSAFTGEIGVVGGACGPGVMNYYMSIANSWAENLPILYLGSERTFRARRSPRHPRFQFLPTTDIVKPITKYAAVLEDALMVDEIFQEAFRQLRLGQPGPVYIGLPFDMLQEQHEFGPLVPPQRYRPASFLDTIADHDIAKAAKWLAEAKLPLIVGGAGIRNAHAEKPFRDFAETLNCPVILTHGGRGVLPDTHAQVFDLGLEPGCRITRDADVVFVIGSSIGEKLAFGGHPYFYGQKGFPNYFGDPGRQTWIHLDCDARTIGRNRPVDMGLVGDMRFALPRLVTALKHHAPIPGPRQMAEWQSQREQSFADLYATTTDSTPIHSGRAVMQVQKALPADTVFINGGGAFGLWATAYLHHPIGGAMKSHKLGNLGAGVPYAMGAALAEVNQDRRVCVLTGDGSYEFYLAEIETAVRYQLPIIVVVGYDAGWSLEVPYYMHLCGRTFEVDHQFMRLDRIAQEMGAHGEFCEREEQVAPAVARALASGKPAVVQVVIDRNTNAYQIPNPDLFSRFHADKEIYTRTNK